jgi:acyl-[acyl-carrier-protein] desaturase
VALTAEEAAVGLEPVVAEALNLLKPVADSWQPSDVLPDLSKPDRAEQLKKLHDRAACLSDDVLVVLVGNIVTEEALPSYQTWLNRNHGLADETGADDTPWAQWTRGWTAEENRHGDMLSKYLYLTGRVNMRSVEVTVQHLIRNGFDLKSENDPYKSLVYASFQERATKISHANTGRMAERCGDATLNKMCALIAGDEARHEEAYKRMFARIIEIDPDRALVSFAEMMRQRIVMPARLMSDGTDCDLFSQFAVVAQKSKIYTTYDYAEVISHLIEIWKIGSLTGLSAEAAEAQDYLCALPAKFLAKAERTQDLISQLPKEPFSWIFGRSA